MIERFVFWVLIAFVLEICSYTDDKTVTGIESKQT